MYTIDISKPVHAHFIGIGGTSMSGLAEYLLRKGFTVTGSDSAHSKYTLHLEEMGIRVGYPQKADNIPEDTDVVVYSAAIHPGNPEYDAAVERGIPMMNRAELLGQLMRLYRHAINISGTHGKTTTTAMVTNILIRAGLDPTVEIGGILDDIGGNMRMGGDEEYFVAEACEYTNSYHSFFPTTAVILNVEEDHLDFFKDLDDIRHSFRRFVELLPEGGTLVIHGGIRDVGYFSEGLPIKVLTFSAEEVPGGTVQAAEADGTGAAAGAVPADYMAKDVHLDDYARASFYLYEKGAPVGRFKLGVPGEHNVQNALAAIACARSLGVGWDQITPALEAYHGAQRRFDRRGTVNGFTVMDDYAHNPQEEDAVLRTLAKMPHRQIWALHQPHTFSRTARMMEPFAEVLSKTDNIVVMDIFPARETNTIGVKAETLVEKIREKNPNVWYCPTFDDVEEFIMDHAQPGDIVITLGCGNANILSDRLVEKYGKKTDPLNL